MFLPQCLRPCMLWLCALLLIAPLAHAKESDMPAVTAFDESKSVMIPPPSEPNAPLPPAAQGVWQHTVPDLATWWQLSREQNGEEFSKFVIDLKTGAIYFVDAHVFALHVDFVLDFLQKKPRTRQNIIEYNRNYARKKPHFVLGYLTHYPQSGHWVFSFWEGDTISAAQILQVKRQLDRTFLIAPLAFRPDSPAQEREARALPKQRVQVIHNDVLYKAKVFQALNVGHAIGRLNITPKGTPFDQLVFGRDEIALLQESYPDITPVAGIITTHFSTPLSHVNLRATAWNIPNAGDKNAAKRYADLNGKVVVLDVRTTEMTLRAATDAEITAWQHALRAVKHVTLPKANTLVAALRPLEKMHAADVILYGTKAANLGEIASAQLANVNVPTGFGVPFYYYVQHLQQNGIDKEIAALLNSPAWRDETVDPAWRERTAQLASLRARILQAPLNPATLDLIYAQVQRQMGDAGVFVRSSTNAEDLPGFNGAGLYDTVPNVKGKAALGEALKTVWASLWNLRAVEERHAFGIDDTQVFAAVLIQLGVNASAAGVLVTKDVFGNQPRTFTINAKWGLGMRVVEGQKIPEQILYDTGNFGTRIISRSDESTMLVFDPKGGIREQAIGAQKGILTEARAKALGTMVQAFEHLFPQRIPCPNALPTAEDAPPRQCLSTQASVLDVEWVLAGEKIWIVQARPYIGH